MIESTRAQPTEFQRLFGPNPEVPQNLSDIPADQLSIEALSSVEDQRIYPAQGNVGPGVNLGLHIVFSFNRHWKKGRSLTKVKSTETETFIRSNQMYVTLFNRKFYTFPIIIDSAEQSPYLLRLKELPPIFREGFVCYNKAVYFVTVDDLRRGVVRKSRALALSPRRLTYRDFENGTIATRTYEAATRQAEGSEASQGRNSAQGSDPEPAPSENLRSVSGDAEYSESKLADRAFEEQMLALLRAEGSEEWEWEVSDHP